MTNSPPDILTPAPESKPDEPDTIYQKARSVFEPDTDEGKTFPEHFLSLGGYTIRLRFSDSLLPSYIIPALKHLTTASTSTPSLTVYILDCTFTVRQVSGNYNHIV